MSYVTPSGYTPQTPLGELRHRGGFMVSEAEGHRSRDQATITGAAKFIAGTILGKQSDATGTGAVTVAAASGNTGNGTLTIDATAPTQANAQPGAYVVKFDAATKFTVFDPSGKEVGNGTVGTAFVNQIKFNTAAGGTAWAVDDSFILTVAAGSGKYTILNPTAADGTEVALAILFGTTDVTLGDRPAAIITRQCEVNASELIWPAGITSPQQATALAQLAAQGIITR